MMHIELNKICKIQNGYAFKSTDYKNKGIPLIRISNFNNGPVSIDDKSIFVDESYLLSKEEFIVEKGDVLIALSGATTGKYGIYSYNRPSLLNQRIGLLKSGTSSMLNDKYFYYYLAILQKEILRKAGGAAQPNISTKAIGELKIPLPPLPQQKKIAAILDAADTYRQKTKNLIAKYDELSQSLFLDMFGDPVKNEKGYPIVRLKDITYKITDGVHSKPNYTQQGIEFISVKDITTGKLKFDTCKYISEEDHKKYFKRCNPEYMDILYTKVGATYGRPAIVDVKKEFSLYVSVALLKLIHNKVNSLYLKEAMANPAIKRQADKSIKGIGVPDLHLNMIKDFIVPLPKMDAQNQFASRIKEIESQKSQAQKSLEKADELFNSLLQRAFKGELNT
ncbi:MAG: restriction endonuclease subunit S [Bacteroidales bacterium]|nr:restriction endonuclease subunit S [Bacteroidales bacterium]